MAPSPSTRRRKRSTRLSLAALLLVIAAAFVAVALSVAAPALVGAAAVAAVVLGAIATRMTYSELLAARRAAAQDRAVQARSFAVLTHERLVENGRFIEGMNAALAQREESLTQLEAALCAAQHRVVEALQAARSEGDRADRAEEEGQVYARRLEESDARAAEAHLRVAELMQERETLRLELEAARAEQQVLRAEMDAWQAAVATQEYRRHA